MKFLLLILTRRSQPGRYAMLPPVRILAERRSYVFMIITIRVSDLDGALIKRYAHFNNETVSTLLKRLIMDQIEDDYRKLVARLEEVDSS